MSADLASIVRLPNHLLVVIEGLLDSENRREPDQPHGDTSVEGWLAGV
jgi:hypothetical protein